MKRSLTAALCLTLLGCTAKGPAFSDYDPVGPDEGRLYVYRSPTLAFWAADVVFEVDGQPLASLDVAGYATARVRPGSYIVGAQFDYIGPNTDPPVERRVRVGRGKAVFCGFFSSMDLFWRRWRIECTDEAEAHPDLRECKRQDLDEDSPWKP